VLNFKVYILKVKEDALLNIILIMISLLYCWILMMIVNNKLCKSHVSCSQKLSRFTLTKVHNIISFIASKTTYTPFSYWYIQIRPLSFYKNSKHCRCRHIRSLCKRNFTVHLIFISPIGNRKRKKGSNFSFCFWY